MIRVLRLTDPPMCGADVAAWNEIVGVAGDVYGEASETATRIWQRTHGLVPDGVVDGKARSLAHSLKVTPPEPFVAMKRKPKDNA